VPYYKQFRKYDYSRKIAQSKNKKIYTKAKNKIVLVRPVNLSDLV